MLNLLRFTPHLVGRRWAGGLALLAWLLLLLPQLGHAQTATSYTFAPTTGAALEDMSTGTTQLVASGSDDGASSVTAIGFSFTYAGTAYTQFSANANGLMRLGSTVVSGAFSNTSTSSGFLTTTNIPEIAPLFDDLATGSAAGGGKVHYKLLGSTPNRKLVVEWFVTVPRSTSGAANARFQVWLNETTNAFDFVYGAIAANTANSGATIGHASSVTSYESVTAPAGTMSTSVHNGTNTTAIPAGTRYTFALPAGCTGTPTAGTTAASPAVVCSGSTTISLSGGSNDAGLSFQLQSSATSGGTYSNVGAAAATASFSVSPTASTYYRIITTCTNSSQSATSAPVQVVVPPLPGYVAIPYTQTFEATWTSTCGTQDIPDANWRPTPAMGDNSWRRYDDGASASWTSTSGAYTPAGSNAGGASSSQSARFHTFDAPTSATGQLDLYANVSGGAGTPTLIFDYINTSGSDKLEVLLSTDGGQTFSATPLFSQVLAANWTSYTVPLTGATATSVIRFRATSDFGFTDLGLDNVNLSFVSCSPVTSLAVGSITSTTASVSFTAPIGGASYTVTYTPTGGPATTVTPAPTASPVVLPGLAPSTTYTVSVAANCTGGTTSTLVSTTFTTAAPPVNFTVARNTGVAYASIQSTGTAFSWQTSANTDDNATTTVPLTAGSTATGATAFAFNYLGTAITGFQVSTNGWLTFKTTNTVNSGGTTYTNNLSNTDIGLMLAPFWEDLVIQGNPNNAAGLNAAKIKYQVSGTAPNRTLTVEWAEMETFNNPGPSLNFEVILTETANTIEYRYGNMSGFDGSQNYNYTYSVGMNGAATSTPNVYLAQDVANSTYFRQDNASSASPSNTSITATTVLTAAQRGNSLSVVPACFSSLVFTPAASFTPGTAPAATAPANDEASAATTLTLGTAAPTDFCAVYSSANATASSGITACSATTPGTPDDDVWFKFDVPVASSVTVTLRSAGTYNGVLQLFNADGTGNLLPASPVACVNATGAGLTENYAANLAAGTYYVRVYEAGTGSGYNGTFVVAAYATPTPPANDECVAAISLPATSLTCTPVTGTTLAATASAGIPVCSATTPGTPDDDVWYSFTTSATNSAYTITLQGASGFDGVLQLLSGSCGSLAAVGCINSTSTGGAEVASATGLTASTTYYLRIYHAGSGTGSGSFTICVVPTCVAPTSVSSTAVTATTASITFTAGTGSTSYTVTATPTTGSPVTASGATSPIALTGLTANTAYSVVVAGSCGASSTTYSFTTGAACTAATSVSSTSVTATTASITFTAGNGSTSYTVTATPTTGSPVTASGTASPIALTGLTASTAYSVVITGDCGSSSTAYSFTTSSPPPANDECTAAISLTPGSTCTPTSGTTVGATASGPTSCAGTADDDVWYSFVPSSSVATITVVGGTNFDAVINLRSGSCASGASVTCADNTSSAGTETIAATGLTPGATYYVRVYEYYAIGSSSGAPGAFTICVTQPSDLIVDGTNSPYTASGTYNNVTINNGGTANLSADLTVNGTLTINNGGTLNTAGNQVLGTGNFTLLPGGTLGIQGANGISVGPATTGVIRNTGATRSFSPDASYVYNGTAAQVTGAGLPATVRNLTTTNANTVTLTAPVSVTQTVTVGGAGNLALSGNALTLLSSSTGTALIVNSGTGVVSGSTGVAQRYIDGSLNSGAGYRHYSAPVSGSNVGDLATSGFSPTLNTAYNASATPGLVTPFPTVFGYDQSRLASVTSNYSAFDKGWVVPAATSTPLAIGQGYSVQIAASQLVDFAGTFTTGNQSVSLARNSGATAADAGWALVGNPYPAPIDWSLVTDGTDRTGLDAAIYVFQSAGPYTGNYRSYANGVGGNPVVPMAQGFFVRVSNGQTSGSLNFKNSHRLTSPDATPFQRTADTRPLVQLDLRGAGFTDAFYAYAEAGTTTSFDNQYDARKLPNSTGLNLASASPVGESLAIDGRPAFTAGTSIPLTVGVPAAGTYSLGAATLANLPAGLDAYLTDAATGQTVQLSQGSYTFSLTSAQAASLITGRFTLHFSARSVLATATGLTAADVSVYPNPAHESFTVLMPAVANATSVQAELLNALGQVVRKQSVALPTAGARFAVATADLATGVYTLRLQAGSTTLTKRVVIN